MMKPLISIIIPFYNTDWKLMKQCLDSIHHQKINSWAYQNKNDSNEFSYPYEVIIIDDSSTEQEMVEKCKAYTAEKKQFRMIKNDVNRGVSYSRNHGIDEAEGEYLMFVDSDDWIIDGALEKLINIIQSQKPDTIFYDFLKYSDGMYTPMRRDISDEQCIMLGSESIIRMIVSPNFNMPWAALYSRSIIEENHIRFPEEVTMGEDFLFNVDYMEHYNKGTYFREELYVYRNFDRSATHTFSLKHMQDSGRGYYRRKELVEKYFSDAVQKEWLYNIICTRAVSGIRMSLLAAILSGADNTLLEKGIKLPWVQDALEHKVTGIIPNLSQIIVKHELFCVLRILAKVKWLAMKIGVRKMH